MIDEEKAYIWFDGYLAGLADEERCEHRTNWFKRLVWKMSSGRAGLENGTCYLYTTPNPYMEDESS